MLRQANHPYRIGIDLLGGDLPTESLLRSFLATTSSFGARAEFVLFVTPSLAQTFPPPSHVRYHLVSEVITMEDLPLPAIRKKKQSSLNQALQELRQGKLDGLISSGNTGALVAASQITLGCLPSIKRPALVALIPTQKEHKMATLDVGASFDTKQRSFKQLAFIGIAYQQVRGIAKPRVALLNVGTEIYKGTPALQEAHSLLSSLASEPHASFTFLGNREGRELFSGEIDVLVTDGFTGNVFLKTAEGTAAALLEQLSPSPLLKAKMHYTEHPGSLLAGVNGLVIKCHGNGEERHLICSVEAVIDLLDHNFLTRFSSYLNCMY